MDRTLLQEEASPTPLPHTDNDETGPHPVPDPEPEVQQYRDLAFEKPQAPLRVKLDPPVEFDGHAYRELILDFDAMVGKDFQRAEREFQHLYKAEKNEMPLPELKHLYHCIIAAHLANVPLGVILKLPRRVYTPLRTEVLKACGSSPEEENQ